MYANGSPQSAPSGRGGSFANGSLSLGTNIENAIHRPSGDHVTPLGLSVTFGIIREHNGTIEAFSPPPAAIQEGRGTQFIIVLPRALNREG